MAFTKPYHWTSARFTEREKRLTADDASRVRRLKQLLESLENDNSVADPHSELVMSKKLPKFDDTKESRTLSKKQEKQLKYYNLKYSKGFEQLIEQHRKDANNSRMYYADPPTNKSEFPDSSFCVDCGFFANYVCVSCGNKLCSNKCLTSHHDTSCLK